MAGGKLWAASEDKIVRDTWASNKLMKECLDLLPGRTEKALFVRIRDLGLGPRPKTKRRAESAILKMVMSEIQRGYVMSTRDIANKYKCSIEHAEHLMKKVREAKQVHVHSWKRSRPGGCWMAVYGFGAGEDAIRPSPKTLKERNRGRRLQQRIKEGRIGNVFAVAMAQVLDQEPPKLSKGRYTSRIIREAA